MFRITSAALALVAISGVSAYAADDVADPNTGTKVIITQPAAPSTEKRPTVLPVLYASLAGLQAYDVYSTRTGISQGARELNPVVAPVAGQTTNMVVMKAVSTATTIVVAEHLWHQNKVAAIVTMVVANGVMAAVAAHNAQVLQAAR